MMPTATSIGRPWPERPQDVAHLLNPAYVGLMLYRAVTGFHKEKGKGMPFELLFLVPSFVLHGATRARLPGRIDTTLTTWLQEEKDVILEFGKRTRELVPYTKEAVSFLLVRHIILPDEDGSVSLGQSKPRGVTAYQHIGDEIEESYKRAEFVGRWLARSGNPMTIYALLGISP